jgi:hypothetical protein
MHTLACQLPWRVLSSVAESATAVLQVESKRSSSSASAVIAHAADVVPFEDAEQMRMHGPQRVTSARQSQGWQK